MPTHFNTEADIDALIAYVYGDRETLSPEQIEKLKRLEQCSDLIRKHGSRLKVIPLMVKLFSKGGKPYTAKKAQQDFDDTTELFGASKPTSKNFWFDIVLGMMMETRQNAYVKRNYSAASIIEARILGAIKDFVGDSEAYPIEKLQPPRLELGFFPEQLKVDMPANFEDQLAKLMESKKRKELMLDPQDIQAEEEL